VISTDSAIPRNASEASVEFLLEPHFYQTRWFYALCAALAALGGWLAFQIYARHTKARYALLLAERTRLAREMHDTIIQGCVGVSTLLEAASGFERIDTGRMNQLLDHARTQLRLTLDEARQAVWNLRQAGIENDIAGALGEFARQLSSEKGVPIEVEIAGSPPHFEEQTLRTVLLVAREAIRNAANHANPRRIHIRMAFEDNEARLEVIDDGRGFEPSSALARPKGHYGIIGMRERVQELGGDFQLRSSPGHGTTVIVRLPVKEAV
jgi:signal transduction histidine kinase